MKQKLEGVFVCCGVDWITVTARPSAEMELLREQSFALAAVEMSSGEFGRPWRGLGYEGFSVGGVFYGERYDGCIFQLTSHVAASHWRRAYENCTSVTRLDLQATVRTSEDPYAVIKRHYQELRRRNSKLKKAPSLRLVVADSESLTVYSGSPQSERYGYIYDKGRESGQKSFQNCVRYEVRFRGKKAKATAAGLFRFGSSASQVGRRSLAFFADRGCSVQSLNKQFRDLASVDDLIYPIGPSTLHRKQEWLRKQVGPTARIIAERIGIDATVELLGLH